MEKKNDINQLIGNAIRPDGSLDLETAHRRAANEIKACNGGQDCDVMDGPCSCGAWHNPTDIEDYERRQMQWMAKYAPLPFHCTLNGWSFVHNGAPVGPFYSRKACLNEMFRRHGKTGEQW